MEFFRRIAEQQIEEAAQNGEFDDLPNAGQKIDYQEYMNVPSSVRLLYKLLKDGNCLPAEVELMNEIAALKGELNNQSLSKEQREKLRKILNYRMIERELRQKR